MRVLSPQGVRLADLHAVSRAVAGLHEDGSFALSWCSSNGMPTDTDSWTSVDVMRIASQNTPRPGGKGLSCET